MRSDIAYEDSNPELSSFLRLIWKSRPATGLIQEMGFIGQSGLSFPILMRRSQLQKFNDSERELNSLDYFLIQNWDGNWGQHILRATYLAKNHLGISLVLRIVPGVNLKNFQGTRLGQQLINTLNRLYISSTMGSLRTNMTQSGIWTQVRMVIIFPHSHSNYTKLTHHQKVQNRDPQNTKNSLPSKSETFTSSRRRQFLIV